MNELWLTWLNAKPVSYYAAMDAETRSEIHEKLLDYQLQSIQEGNFERSIRISKITQMFIELSQQEISGQLLILQQDIDEILTDNIIEFKPRP